MQLVFWLVETIFSHFFQTEVNYCPWKAVYSSTGAYFSANTSFRLVETTFLPTGNSIILFRGFCSTSEWNIIENQGGEFLKTNHISASGHQFFQIL